MCILIYNLIELSRVEKIHCLGWYHSLGLWIVDHVFLWLDRDFWEGHMHVEGNYNSPVLVVLSIDFILQDEWENVVPVISLRDISINRMLVLGKDHH